MNDRDDLLPLRHSMAHLLAEAVLELYPGAKLGTGPATEDGFWYDFELPHPIEEGDLPKIEERMREILKRHEPISREEIGLERARELFADQPYKLEIIDRLVETGRADPLSIYRFGGFTDLCGGPHVADTREIKPNAFKLVATSGAYWRGDSERPMLCRIRGTGWRTKQDLKAHLQFLEEVARRDHRIIGQRLGLFSHSQDVGRGLVLWHPPGAMVRFLAERFSQTAHVLNGYQWVYTPHIGHEELWQTSGHLDFYRDSMYGAIEIDDERYHLKPMSCPFHIQIFKSTPKSYRELPLRYAEFATVYRYELSGTLQGLTRVRGFTQDDAHVFCTPEQLGDEIRRALEFSLYILRAFGLEDFQAYLSTRPEEKSIGDDEAWERATGTLREALEAVGVPYELDPGGGAFYGPKIDLKLKDAIGREWQLSTVQLDFNLPDRFELEYVGADGERHRPYMVHRALFGSVERFMAMLIEHFMGSFPLWIAPVQVGFVPVADRHNEEAERVADLLRHRGLRVEVDTRPERMNAKIRDMELRRLPFIAVVGDKEVESGELALRIRGEKGIRNRSLDAFFETIQPELDRGVPRPIH